MGLRHSRFGRLGDLGELDLLAHLSAGHHVESREMLEFYSNLAKDRVGPTAPKTSE